MTTTSPLEWTKTSPTTYERAIDDFERFYLFIAVVGQGRPDKQNWHTTTAIKISTKRDHFTEDIKAAWKALRYDHPTFSAIIRTTVGSTMPQTSKTYPRGWRRHSTSMMSLKALASSFPSRQTPADVLYCTCFPRRKSLCFKHHTRM